MERQLSGGADQAANLRQRAGEKLDGVKRACYLSVSSGKGGVGKTTFAVSLASELAKLGKRALLFDADLGLANVDVMLRIAPGANIRAYLAGKAGLDEVIVKTRLGFDLFPASSGVLGMADVSEENFDKIKGVIDALGRRYDYIIFDTGAGINANVHRFARLADKILVVTLPEPAAISDAYAFLKTAGAQYKVSVAYLVFNRVDEEAGALRIFENLKGVVRKFLQFELVLLGMLREDAQIRRSARGSNPAGAFEAVSGFSGSVSKIAAKI